MPPKSKDTAKIQILRPDISNASLNYIPDNAVEGFQERIETNVDWILEEQAAKHHKKKCKGNIGIVTFSDALQNKIRGSILRGFLEESNISLTDQWEAIMPMTLWDNEKFGSEESEICFKIYNSLTDKIDELVYKGVRLNDRSLVKKEFQNTTVLRLLDAKMTELDDGLKKFKKLQTLNLCGNYIKEIKSDVLPQVLAMMELQMNCISDIEHFAETLPVTLNYLGLARNCIDDGSVNGIAKLRYVTVLDLSDNDIYNLDAVLHNLLELPNLTALALAGNPCAMCAAYARTTATRLSQLQWLDGRDVSEARRPDEPFDPHPDDLRSNYFVFTIFRIISVPQPPKTEKGATTSFHVELEVPLLDSTRRAFLMMRNNESLIEYLPPPEDEEWIPAKTYPSLANTLSSVNESDIYNRLVAVDSREIRHYTTFESNKVQWNKIMTFQEPAIKIFCPDLVALRNTFRTVITLRLIFTLSLSGKQNKLDKKSSQTLRQASENRVTLATIRCTLNKPDWGQPSQDFHWDDTLGTEDAVYCKDTDLSAIQYNVAGAKTPKAKPDLDVNTKPLPPDDLTCQFGFSIDTVRT